MCIFQGLLVLVVLSCSYAGKLSSSLTLAEQQRIVGQLQQQYNNLPDAFYAVTSLKFLGKEIGDPANVCKMAIGKVDTKDCKSLYQLSEIVKTLGCKNVPDFKSGLAALLNEDNGAVGFAYVISAMANFGYDVDPSVLKDFVTSAKENDTPVSAALSFYAASLLPKSDTLKPIVDMVEDIVAQADEVGGTMLQFEGGLAVTSGVIRGIVALSVQQGKNLLKHDQLLKFSEYFVNRKYVYDMKDVHYMLAALSALSNNQYQVPVVVSVYQTNVVTSESPNLKVRVTNLLDKSIPDVKVTAASIIPADGGSSLLENKAFTKSTGDDYIFVDSDVARGYVAAHPYELDVYGASPARGLYKVAITVEFKKDVKHYLTGGSFEISCRVLAKVSVADVQIGISDADQKSPASMLSINYPEKLGSALDADYHQKVVMTFTLKDSSSGESVTAHQTFVRLTNEASGQEVFFVAEADKDESYKFTLDVGATGKDSFNNLSGKYKMALLVGDASLQVPVNWEIGVLSLTFSGEPKTSKREMRVTVPKPVLEHTFRVPEKRPSVVVSTAFTLMVVLPFLVMFGMWLKVGANISNFQLSLSALLFHFGLAGIFGLYYMFWIQLNMFQTLKLLALVGGLTFLGGNKMLAQMATNRAKQ